MKKENHNQMKPKLIKLKDEGKLSSLSNLVRFNRDYNKKGTGDRKTIKEVSGNRGLGRLYPKEYKKDAINLVKKSMKKNDKYHSKKGMSMDTPLLKPKDVLKQPQVAPGFEQYVKMSPESLEKHLAAKKKFNEKK